ncbi:MAG: hypothetical protein WCH11_02325 [Bdellovibrio sp.]
MPFLLSLAAILGTLVAPKTFASCGFTLSAERCSRMEDLTTEQFLQKWFYAEVQKVTNHAPVQRLLRWILPSGGGFFVDPNRGELISTFADKSFFGNSSKEWSLNNRDSASPNDSRWIRTVPNQSIFERIDFHSWSDGDFLLIRQTSLEQTSKVTWLHAGKSGVKSVVFCPSAPQDCFILSPKVCASFVEGLQKGQFSQLSIQDRLKRFREDWLLEMRFFEKLYKEDSQNTGRSSLISDFALSTKTVDHRLQHSVGWSSGKQLMDICLYMSL